MYVYDEDFVLLDTVLLPKEMKNSGWGLANDGTYLYATSGSSGIFKINSTTYQLEDIIYVTNNQGKPVNSLNECEIVDQSIYWNIFQTTYIYKINYSNGSVEQIYNLSALYKQALQVSAEKLKSGGKNFLWSESDYSNNVLNGIAYNDLKDTFYVTGKRWPVIFEVKFTS